MNFVPICFIRLVTPRNGPVVKGIVINLLTIGRAGRAQHCSWLQILGMIP